MKRNIKTTRLTEAALITGILVIFSMVGTFIFPFLDFIYPLPAIVLAKRHDYKITLLSLIAAATITTMVLGIQAGVFYIFLYSPLAFVMALLISKDKKPSLVISAGTITYIFSFLFLIFAMQKVMGVSFTEQMEQLFKESFGLQESIMSKFDGMQGNIEQFKTMYDNILNVLIRIIPAMILMASVAMASLNYFVAYKLSRKLRINIRPIEDFSKFKLPENFSIGILIIIVCMLLLKNMNFTNYDNLYINLIYLVSMLFFVQGLALLRYLFIKYKVGKGLRVLVVLMLFIIPLVMNIIMLMGAGELIFDFRKLKRRNKRL